MSATNYMRLEHRPPMRRIRVRIRFAWMLLAVACSSLQAFPALEGTVVEGHSAPGISLGLTRAQVEAAYGSPSFCQGPTRSFCTYNSSGVGSVNTRYEGPAGGAALGTDDDLVYHISWSGFSNWVTTAGVSTATALADPSSVVSAYPAGTITTNAQGGIYSVRESEMGIQVIWTFDPYSGITTVSMSLFEGEGPPAPLPVLEVERSGADSILLTWPDNGESTLEHCPDLSTDTWVPVDVIPASENGEFRITLPSAGDAMFFRLVP